MSNKIEDKNIMAFHPGYYLEELIQEMKMTQVEFATRLGITPKNLSDVINGKASISQNIAMNLSLMLGTSVELWLELQKKFDQKVVEMKAVQAIEKEVEDLAMLDYGFFVKLGVVEKVRSKTERVMQLLRFLGVSSFEALKKPDFLVQFRGSTKEDEKTILNANAWVQTVMNIGGQIETQPFSKKKLRALLPQIREMSQYSPQECTSELQSKLASCGVALVLLPSLKSSGVYGATKWPEKDKVVVGVSSRRKYADTFWFSLFHELGHVLQTKRMKTLVSLESGEEHSEFESIADQFAREQLIPTREYEAFTQEGSFLAKDIVEFSKAISIHPGIVVGRLQRDGVLPYSSLNDQKIKYELN